MKPPTLCDPVAPSALYISAVAQSLANDYSTKEQLDAYVGDRGRSEKYRVKIVQQESWMGQQVSKVSVAIILRVTGSLCSPWQLVVLDFVRLNIGDLRSERNVRVTCRSFGIGFLCYLPSNCIYITQLAGFQFLEIPS